MSQIVKAFSYIRFSKIEQEKGDTIRRQQDSRDQWLESKRKSGENVQLDNDLTLDDRGISAYTGANLHHGALGQFLQKVKEGAIPSGSYLVMENLDRLSRADPDDAYDLFRDILRSGVVVVQLVPEVKEFRKGGGFMTMLTAMMEFTRAHGESAMKSDRIGKAWAEKKKNIATKKLTCRVPNWIDVETSGFGKDMTRKFIVNEAKAAVVRRMFALCLDGVGAMVIARKFTEENVPHIAKMAKKWTKLPPWTQSNVLNALKNRSVMGEYQPRISVKVGKKRAGRQNQGMAVKDYYPQIVDEATFFRVQKTLNDRDRNGAGKDFSHKNRNLFSRLVKDPSGLLYIHRVGKGIEYLRTRAARVGDVALANLQYGPFQEVVLTWIAELRRTPNDSTSKVEGLKARKGLLEASITKMTAKIKENPLLDVLYTNLNDLRKEHEEVGKELELADIPRQDILADTQELIKQLESEEDQEGIRNRLRQRIRDLISLIQVERVEGKVFRPEKTVFLKIEFKDGDWQQLWYRTNREGLVGSGDVAALELQEGAMKAIDGEIPKMAPVPEPLNDVEFEDAVKAKGKK